MRKFNLDRDTFAPELESYSVWVDGHPETMKTKLPGRTAALRTITMLRHNYPALFEGKTPIIRMKATSGVPF